MRQMVKSATSLSPTAPGAKHGNVRDIIRVPNGYHSALTMNYRVARILGAMHLLLAPVLAGADTGRVQIPVLIVSEPDANGRGRSPQATVPGIIALLAAESGLDLVVTPLPWRRAQAIAERGGGLLYGAAPTPERARTYRFTFPLDTFNQWLVSTEQSPLVFHSWEDVRGKVISTLSGAHYSAEFEKHRGELFTVEQNSETMTSRMMMLRAKRVDAVIVSSYLDASALEAKLNCLFPGQVKLVVSGRPMEVEPMLIGVPKTAPLNNSLPVLNDAIERLVKSGAMQKFHSQKADGAGC